VNCLPQLRGEFAFALWDRNNQTVFAARDRLGIKPLFYAWHNDTLYLASEVKALFAAGVPARWDHEGFYQGASGFGPPDRTLFEGVFQVPPGHYILATPGSFRLLRYWDFDYPTATELAAQKGDDPSYIEMFCAQLDVAGQLTGRDPLNQALYLWSKGMLPNYVLTMLGDRMEMAHSIEGRVPFLDHHVIECLR